jgi:hypothetical protein
MWKDNYAVYYAYAMVASKDRVYMGTYKGVCHMPVLQAALQVYILGRTAHRLLYVALR